MTEVLERLFNITIIVFMAGNLLEVGLSLETKDALSAIRNIRFLIFTLFWCFVFGPILAAGLTSLIPLAAPYAMGLALLGLAPCTPAMPIMVKLSGGSKAYMSAFMVTAYAGTVLLMPFLTPVLAPGLSADAWAIAKPLLFFVALPFVAGVIVRFIAIGMAERGAPLVKLLTTANTVILVGLMLWLYRADLFSAIGTYAAATQLTYYALLGTAAHLFSYGLPYEQRSVMVIGVATRNVGPALAPLIALPNAPPEAIAMCILAVLLGAIISGFAAAWILKHFASPAADSKLYR